MRLRPLTFIGPFITTVAASAQNIQPTLIDAAPLTLNAAYAGMFPGDVRASATFRDAWEGRTAYSYRQFAIDAPVYTSENGNYLAIGAQWYDKTCYGGSYRSVCGMGSVAYHWVDGNDSSKRIPRLDFGIGTQVGYAGSNYDMSFPLFYPGYVGVLSRPSVATREQFVLNVGTSLAYAVNSGFTMTLGINAQNLIPPGQSPTRKDMVNYRMDRRVIGSAGADIRIFDRLCARPAIVGYNALSRTLTVGGSDFVFRFGGAQGLKFIAGAWYRSDYVVLLSPGLRKGGFWLRTAIELGLGQFEENDNGVEFAMGFDGFLSRKRHRHVVCTRF